MQVEPPGPIIRSQGYPTDRLAQVPRPQDSPPPASPEPAATVTPAASVEISAEAAQLLAASGIVPGTDGHGLGILTPEMSALRLIERESDLAERSAVPPASQ